MTMHATSRIAFALVLAAAAAAAAGCADRTLVEGLSREEAQRCAIVLRASGLDASVEEASGAGEHRVSVSGDDADLRTALQKLEEHGLPRRTPPGFSTGSSGLMASPSEERARYIKGLSGEIEGLLESIDGIVAAEVLVSLPERRPLVTTSDEVASASAVISHTGDASPVSEDEVRAIVVRAVGSTIVPERVTVLLKPVVRAAAAKPVIRYERDRIIEAGFVIAVGVLGALHAVTVWRMRSLRLRAAAAAGGEHAG